MAEPVRPWLPTLAEQSVTVKQPVATELHQMTELHPLVRPHSVPERPSVAKQPPVAKQPGVVERPAVAEQPAASPASVETPCYVRVFTYNILVPPYGMANHLPLCDPKDLEPQTRLERVLQSWRRCGASLHCKKLVLIGAGPCMPSSASTTTTSSARFMVPTTVVTWVLDWLGQWIPTGARLWNHVALQRQKRRHGLPSLCKNAHPRRSHMKLAGPSSEGVVAVPLPLQLKLGRTLSGLGVRLHAVKTACCLPG